MTSPTPAWVADPTAYLCETGDCTGTAETFAADGTPTCAAHPSAPGTVAIDYTDITAVEQMVTLGSVHAGIDADHFDALAEDASRRGEPVRYGIVGAYDLAREEDDRRTRARKVEKTWRGEITPERVAADESAAYAITVQSTTSR